MAESGVASLGKKIADLRVIDLKSELEKRGLEKTGVKLALIERLKKALESEGIDPDEWELVGTSATPKTTLTRKAVGEKFDQSMPREEDGDSRHSETQPEHEGSSDMVDLNVEDDSRLMSDDDEHRVDISAEREMEDALLADDVVSLEYPNVDERSDEVNEENVELEPEAFERDAEDELLGHDEEQEEGCGEGGDGEEAVAELGDGEGEEMEPSDTEDTCEPHSETLLSPDDTDADLNTSAELMGSKSATDVTESEEPTETATPVAEPVAMEMASTLNERVDRKTDEELFLLVDDDLDNDIIGGTHATELPHTDAAVDVKPSQQQPTKKMAVTATDVIAKKNAAVKSQTATGVAEKKTDGAAAAGTTGSGSTAEDSESATAASSVSSTPSKSTQRPDEQISRSASLASSASRNLWVSGLSAATRAADLKALFSKHGKVTGAKIVTNAKSPGAKCYGFVTLATTEEASKCIQHLHRTELHGRMISVERAKTDPSSHAQLTEKRPVQSAPKSGEGTPRGNLVAKRLAVNKPNAESPKKLMTAVAAKPSPLIAAVKRDEPAAKKPIERTEETKKTLEQKEPIRTEKKVAGAGDASPVNKDNKDQPKSPKRMPTAKQAPMRRDNGPRVPLNKNTRRSDFRERMRQRMWEQRQREAERKHVMALEREKARQRMMQREQQEEAMRLERERERLRLDKQRLELERLEAERERILLERERQKRERERLELAREEERRRIELLRHQELIQQRERAALKRSHDLVAPSSSSSSYWQNSKRPAMADYSTESRGRAVAPSAAASRGMPDRTGRPVDRSLDRRDADRRHEGLHSPDRTPRTAEKLRDRSADGRRSGGMLPSSATKLVARLEHPRSAEHLRQVDRSRVGTMPHSADRSRDHGPHTPNVLSSSGGRSEWKAPPTGDRSRTSHQSTKDSKGAHLTYSTLTSAHPSRDGWHSAGHASSSSASKLRGGYNSTPSGSAATAHWSDRGSSTAQPHSTSRSDWSGSRTAATRGGSSSYMQPPASNAMMSGSSRVHQGERFSAFKSSALPSSANRRY